MNWLIIFYLYSSVRQISAYFQWFFGSGESNSQLVLYSPTSYNSCDFSF